MNWENSKVITPLKRDFLNSFFEKEKRFFLTGGSALGIFYLQHRYSYDLDLFSLEEFDWREIDGTLRLVCSEIKATLNHIQTSPTFRRYKITRNDESEILDFVRELCPQINSKKETFGIIIVDTLHEILVNKICTLVSRCELKDLIDIYFLDKKGMHVEDYIDKAKLKDGGFDSAIMSMLLSNITISELPEYLEEEISIKSLKTYIESLRLKLASISYPDS